MTAWIIGIVGSAVIGGALGHGMWRILPDRRSLAAPATAALGAVGAALGWTVARLVTPDDQMRSWVASLAVSLFVLAVLAWSHLFGRPTDRA